MWLRIATIAHNTVREAVRNKLLYTQVIASPTGDRLLADFAKVLIVNEGLGKDSVPDYLSVSFSGSIP